MTKRKIRIFFTIVAVTLAIALLCVACGKEGSGTEGFNITSSEAGKIAMAHLGVSETEVKDTKVTAEVKQDGQYYSVEFMIGNIKYAYKIDPGNGAVKSLAINDQSVDEKNAPVAPVLPTAEYIGEEKAKEIVFASVGCAEKDVTELEVDFDFDDGQYLYEVEFEYNGSKYEYELVAATGEVYKVDIDEITAVVPVPSDESVEYIGIERAKEIAILDSGVAKEEAVFEKVKFEKDHGAHIYEVEFTVNGAEYEYEINAVSGAIIKKETDDKLVKPENPTQGETIGAEEALKIAFAHAGVNESETTEQETKLKVKKGKYVYEIEFKSGAYEYEYEIDATSGSIIEVEKELDD